LSAENLKVLPMSSILRCLERLKEAFYALPSVTPKGAAKLATDFIKLSQEERVKFMNEISQASQSIKICAVCGNFSTADICDICSDTGRRDEVVCVVEDVMDVTALEDAGFDGKYHVLGGRIDPLNKVMPDDLNIAALFKRLAEGKIKEVIIGTNLNRKGAATARYIFNEIKRNFGNITVTQPAHGLSEGSEIIYVNPQTLKEAVERRTSFQ